MISKFSQCIISGRDSMLIALLIIAGLSHFSCYCWIIGYNSYNSWYLLSLPSSFTLHHSILFLIISVILYSLISCYFRCYIKFSLYVLILYLLLMNVKLRIHLSLLILSSFFSNSTFFIPIFLDFFIIFPIFFFKGPI